MSKLNVAKFGGTSVADHTAMSRCAAIIEQNPETKLVLISACSGVTNLLVELASGIEDKEIRDQKLSQLASIHQQVWQQLSDSNHTKTAIREILDGVASAAEAASYHASKKLTDHIVASGELMSTLLFTQLLKERGLAAQRFDIRDVMRTDDNFGKAEAQLGYILSLTQEKLLPLCQHSVVVSQGFIGSDVDGNTTTFGRGGSDYSAALLAEALQADELQIWTDVPGIYTTDPRIAKNARPISEISFSEASEMANFGAKILHPSTLVPALRCDIPVFVGSSKQPEAGGTWIRQQVQSEPLFRALALRRNQTMVTLRSASMFHAYGFLAKVFEVLAKHKISVDLITTSEISVSLTLDQTDTSGGTPELPQEVKLELEQLCTVEVEHNLCLVALIGNNISKQKGYASRVFSSAEDFNLKMICYGASPHNLCFLVHEDESCATIQKLHLDLFEA